MKISNDYKIAKIHNLFWGYFLKKSIIFKYFSILSYFFIIIKIHSFARIKLWKIEKI